MGNEQVSCISCGDTELCGMYLTPRGGVNDKGRSETVTGIPLLYKQDTKGKETQPIGKLKVQSRNFRIMPLEGPNLFQLADEYVYLLTGTMSKDFYDTLSMTKMEWRNAFRAITTCIVAMGKFRGYKIKEMNWEKEAWRMVLASSQEHYPISTGSKWIIRVIKGISCRVTRLEDEDAMMIFGTIMSPIISTDDPVLGKLTRLAHRGELENKGAMHRTNGSTIAHLRSGKFGITSVGLERLIREFSYGCYGVTETGWLHLPQC